MLRPSKAILAILLTFTVPAQNAFGSEPIEISNVEELLGIINDSSGSYRLVSSLDLAFDDADTAVDGTQTANDVTTAEASYLGNFSGTFDGNGKTISGLNKPLFFELQGSVSNINLTTVPSQNDEDGNYIGFIGQGILAVNTVLGSLVDSVNASGELETIYDNAGGLVAISSGSIINSNTSGTIKSSGSYVGGLVGATYGGEISGSSSTMSIDSSGYYVGGLVGYADDVLITNSYASGNIESIGDYVGGLVGFIGSGLSGDISDSHAIISMETSPNSIFVGGLVGRSYRPISNSFSIVTGDLTGFNAVGGLVGYANNEINNSYAYVSGDVLGNYSYYGLSNFGGLVGTTDGPIVNSYAFVGGDVSGPGDYVGGLVGQSNDLITNSYAFIGGSISGASYVGGLVGESSNIQNSYAIVEDDVLGNGNVGGLTGKNNSGISNSFASISGSIEGSNYTGGLAGDARSNIQSSSVEIRENISGVNFTGGLVGKVWNSNITNSNALIGGNITGYDSVGGLVGSMEGEIRDSIAQIGNNVSGHSNVGGISGYVQGNIVNSDASIEGNILGTSYLGGIAGRLDNGYVTNSDVSLGGIGDLTSILIYYLYDGNINDSYTSYTGIISSNDPNNPELVGSRNGSSNLSFSSSEDVYDISLMPKLPSLLDIVNNAADPTPFEVSNCLNSGKPYLIELLDSYSSICSIGPRERTPNLEVRINKIYVLADIRNATEVVKSLGFTKVNSFSPDSGIDLVDSIDYFTNSYLKAVSLESSSRARVSLRVDEALQITLNSGLDESLELWIQTPDKTWFFAGIISFDANGKAVFPPIKFGKLGDFVITLNSLRSNSESSSAPMNIKGELLIKVE